MGWAGKQNGDLLNLAEGSFDVLLTVDSNIRHQQNFAHRSIAAVVVLAPSNAYPTLAPLMVEVEAALRTLAPGQVVEVVHPSMRKP